MCVCELLKVSEGAGQGVTQGRQTYLSIRIWEGTEGEG